MMKNLIPVLAVSFVAVAAPAKADDVRVVVASEVTESGMIDFHVYNDKQKVRTTPVPCKSLQVQGGVERARNMISAYTRDAFEEVNGRWGATQFENQLKEKVTAPINAAATTCGIH